MDIIEGNELIAVFDGRKKTHFNDGGDVTIWWSDVDQIDSFQWQSHDLQYHTSWDWLMPVVEKINKWFDEESENYFHRLVEDDLIITELKISESIKSVYAAVVQFITWYNKNK